MPNWIILNVIEHATKSPVARYLTSLISGRTRYLFPTRRVILHLLPRPLPERNFIRKWIARNQPPPVFKLYVLPSKFMVKLAWVPISIKLYYSITKALKFSWNPVLIRCAIEANVSYNIAVVLHRSAHILFNTEHNSLMQ